MINSAKRGLLNKKTMRLLSRLFSLSIAILILFITSISLGAETDIIKIKVKVQSANVREMPDLGAKIIWQPKYGTVLDAEKKQGSWFKVYFIEINKVQKSVGFIHYSTVEIIEKDIAAKPDSRIMEQRDVIAKSKKEEEPEDVAWIIDSKAKKGENREKTQGFLGKLNISFGIIGGINFASLSDSSYKESWGWIRETTTGFCGGVFLSAKLNKMIDIQSEVMILKKGVIYRGEYIGGPHEFEFWVRTQKICYLEFPVLARLSLQINDRIKPFILTGPFISLKLSGKDMLEISDELADEARLENIKFIDYGFLLGAGCEVNIGSSLKAALQTRYSLGLANIVSQDYQYYGYSIKTGNLSILISLSL